MAKKQTIEADAVVETLVLIPENAKQTALAQFTPFDKQLENLLIEADSLPEITDKLTLKKVQDTSKSLRRFEISIDKTRIASTESIRTILSDLKSHCDGLISQAEAKRKALDEKINAEEIRLQEEAKKEHIRRVELLTSNGWVMTGQFYACGVFRIMFDEIDAADEVKLNEWAQMGKDFIEAERLRVEAEKKRLKEIEDREAALKAQEDELEEFRKWKAMKNGTPVPETETEPVQNTPELGFEWTPQSPAMNPVNSSFNAPPPPAVVATPAPKQPTTERELAEFKGVSISDLRMQPEAKIYWNMAISNVLLRFENESHSKAEWTEIFKNMRKS